MNYIIVYWSRYGNGKRIVDRLSETLRATGAEVQTVTTDEADPAALPDADAYVFSAPTEAFRVQRNMRKFMRKLPGMEGKRYGIINTHAMKRNWLKSMERRLRKRKMVKAASLDLQVGKDADSGNALPNGWEQQVDAFARELRNAL